MFCILRVGLRVVHYLCSQDEPLDEAVLVRVRACLGFVRLGMMPIVCSGDGLAVGRGG